jgi:hypothetical protein
MAFATDHIFYTISSTTIVSLALRKSSFNSPTTFSSSSIFFFDSAIAFFLRSAAAFLFSLFFAAFADLA